MSLRDSAASGDRISALRDLRDILAGQIVATDSARDVASLTARFQSVLAEIAELESQEQKVGDPLDEIAARRAARGGATARTRRAERGTS